MTATSRRASGPESAALLPRGSLAVGRAGWRPPAATVDGPLPVAESPRDLAIRSEPDAPEPDAPEAAAPEAAAHGAAAGPALEPPLVLLQSERLAAEPDGGVALVAELRRRLPGHCPVLVGETLPAPDIARALGVAGLFAIQELPATADDWRRLRGRAGAEVHARREAEALQDEARGVQRRLQEHRELIRAEADAAAAELLRTQTELAAANRELSDHMEQLSLLYRFGRELSTAPNWDETLEGLLRSLAEFVEAAGAALILRSAPGGPYAARQTYRWDETSWDKVLLNLHGQVDAEVAESMLAPGVFRVAAAAGEVAGRDRRIIALPLEHQELRLGYLLLLRRATGPDTGEDGEGGDDAPPRRLLPFLQTVQMVLSEEVAAAQMLDRMRSIGSFNARVLETVSSGIWVLDGEGRTVFCNRAGRELLTGRKHLADPETELVFTIGRGRWRQGESDTPRERGATALPELFLDGLLRLPGISGPPLARLRNRGEAGFRGEANVRREDGATVPVRLQTATMPGRVAGEQWLVIVADDLREARKLEAERLRADRLEGLVEMSAGLAHEIRNPLMGLSAQAELLADQLPPKDPRKRYIDIITGEVARIEGTITRLLSFVRPYEPRLSEAALPDLAAECLDLVRPRAERRNVRLEARVTADPGATVPVRLDPAQIKQVVINLLINAVDASPPGGAVDVTVSARAAVEVADPALGTSRVHPGLALEVRDDGPGVPPADRGRIFRPFFSTKSSGTGLGLAISHKIVTAHGGDIEVARDDGRTVFRVLLPRIGAPERMRTQEAP
ncbi:MAG: ATP-binding protein [Candidatus Krumholzibacteriia bacterium]